MRRKTKMAMQETFTGFRKVNACSVAPFVCCKCKAILQSKFQCGAVDKNEACLCVECAEEVLGKEAN
jgi:hypothetical protein